jgi:hypothetical protein
MNLSNYLKRLGVNGLQNSVLILAGEEIDAESFDYCKEILREMTDLCVSFGMGEDMALQVVSGTIYQEYAIHSAKKSTRKITTKKVKQEEVTIETVEKNLPIRHFQPVKTEQEVNVAYEAYLLHLEKAGLQPTETSRSEFINAVRYYHRIKENLMKLRITTKPLDQSNLLNWTSCVRDLFKLGYTKEDMVVVLRVIMTDTFWAGTIQGASSLSKNFASMLSKGKQQDNSKPWEKATAPAPIVEKSLTQEDVKNYFEGK